MPVRTPNEKTHQQNDDQRFDQHLYELANAGFHRRGLIRHLAQLHTRRQVFPDAFKLGIQCLAQHQDIAAVLHCHGQANCVLTHKAHARRRRIIESATHISHIADA
jgi:hypothetical protein